MMPNEIQVQESDVTRPAYTEPAIVHELALETRAGSPLGGDPLSDPLGLEPAQSN